MSGSPWKLYTQALLLVLLLAAQGLSQAHQVSHLNPGDNQGCDICSISGGLSHGVIDTATTVTPEQSFIPPYPMLATIAPNAYRVILPARSPPLFS